MNGAYYGFANKNQRELNVRVKQVILTEFSVQLDETLILMR